MKLKLTVEVDVDMHGYDGKWTVPGFHQEWAEINDERTSITRINSNVAAPGIFYAFAGTDDPNHGFVATINAGEAIAQAFIASYPELCEQARLASSQPAEVSE